MHFELVPFLCGMFASLLIGLSKTGIPGLSMPGILLMTYAFPGHERFSTGAMLPVLMVGDVIGTSLYRRQIQWRIIRRLLIPCIVGVAAGAYFLANTPDTHFKITLAIIVFCLIVFDMIRKYFKWDAIARSVFFGPALGATTGFTTMYANAGVPPMYVYMTAQRLGKEQYMATWVWLFCILNLIKLPVSCSLGMVNTTTLMFLVYNMLPGLVIGTLLGRRIFLLIPEKLFYHATLFGTLLACLGMMLPLLGLGR
ncbi:MAG: sulfite exporter TauE/SafE family protein [Planctomycetaceae bacterium]|nr:sulfite exporter TauE/SafE family protein [Planctomycetaceae bacterium]